MKENQKIKSDAKNNGCDVSVIVPTYNRIGMLEEALASINNQDFDGTVEVIVVDDNSQDGTSSVIKQKYPDINLITLKENLGSYGARNKALEKAKGKFIAFLDSDDLWESEYLKYQIRALKDKERAFAVSDVIHWYIEENEKVLIKRRPNLNKYLSPLHELLVANFILTPSSTVFPKKVFEAIGHFDHTYRVSADGEFYARCLIAGCEIVYTDKPLAIWRKHKEGQMTDKEHLKIRRLSRLNRVKKLYPLVRESKELPSKKQIFGEIDSKFASAYFRQNKYHQWIALSASSAHKSSVKYALSSMIWDIRCMLSIGPKLRLAYQQFSNKAAKAN